MNFKFCIISVLSVFALTSTAYATNTAKNTKPVNSWTCEDFLAIDESFQPTAVAFAEALNAKNKPEDAILNVDGIEKVTPLIIQACKEDKTLSFKEKVRSEWKKLKKDM
ncbi:acid-activated periplasmic chaperone HdeA [Citrobacter braakii]|nr:acid-activated periplasmic chaperone HdeA [Citrobacter braakii]